ncbi:MAG: FAD-dependent oxidoreductase [Chloroflexi bacterium]|nr:FAD-dependent oxidoreductase [Chloroflexota bacterium]
MKEVEIAIIGGGPGGICAAAEAAKCGAHVVLLDENPGLGGQIYRRLPGGFAVRDEGRLGKDYVEGTKLIRELEQHKEKVEVISGAVVWGVFPGNEIAFLSGDRNERLKANRVILAEGAYDRPVPFPGWTLPGVITGGAALRMVKAERILPGERLLLAGTGPLQLALGAHLVQAGAKVVAILEASSRGAFWKHLPKLLGERGLLKEGFNYIRELQRAKVPVLTGHAVVAVQGDGEVQRAVYARVDNNWKTISGTEKTVEVDTICSGYGLVPSTRLSRLFGCKHSWDRSLGGWVSEHDSYAETTIQGVFTVGECAGVRGALVAAEEGRLAAIRACQQLGRLSEDEARRKSVSVVKRLKKLTGFESALGKMFAMRSGLFAQIPDETVICRCEEITAGEIRSAIAEGLTSIDEIKAVTHAGMGPCQGRICETIVSEMVSIQTGRPPEEVRPHTPRPPVKPLVLGSFAQE